MKFKCVITWCGVIMDSSYIEIHNHLKEHGFNEQARRTLTYEMCYSKRSARYKIKWYPVYI